MPRLEVPQVQEYTRVTVECNSTPSEVAEDVYAGRGQPIEVSNWLEYMDEPGDRILLHLQEFGRVRDAFGTKQRHPPHFA